MNSTFTYKAGLLAGAMALSLLLGIGAEAADRAAAPVRGVTAAHAVPLRGPARNAVFGPDKVNINTADAVTLDRVLLNIGPAKAQAIVDYRKRYGSFKSAEQLALVKGIGLKTVAKNRDRIYIGGGAIAARQTGRPGAQR